MATYNELTQMYRSLRSTSEQRAFRLAHPKWWDNYQAQTALGTKPPAEPGIDAGGNPAPTPTQTATPDKPIPPAPDSVLPEGWSWVWDSAIGQWIPKEGDTDEDEIEPAEDPYANIGGKDNVLSMLRDFLRENELPLTLIDSLFTPALAKGWSYNRILLELRQTAEYKNAYPENELRADNGFARQPEAWIRAYRDDARRIAKDTLGIDLTQAEIAGFIANDRSLGEFGQTMVDYARFKTHGPDAQALLKEELGMDLPDDKAFALFSRLKPTPELERAYDIAWRRAMTKGLGLGIRSREEATLMRQLGYSQEESLSRYKQVATGLPMFQRLQAIEDQLETGKTGNDYLNDVPMSRLLAAFLSDEPDALRIRAELGAQVSREAARHMASSRVSFSGGIATGLNTRDQLARF